MTAKAACGEKYPRVNGKFMGALIDIAGGILSRAERSAEIVGHNIANGTTPGFKRRIDFARLLDVGPAGNTIEQTIDAVDHSAGRLVSTESMLDVALAGDGYFMLKASNETLYTCNGQFSRDADGRLMAGKHVVADANGAEIRLGSGRIDITSDGIVLEGGAPVARLGIVDFMDRTQLRPIGDGAFAAPEELDTVAVDRPVVRQHMIEASNVSTGTEMVAMMAALRRAEAGQRIASTYDDLMGRAITAFGQA